MSFLRKGIIVSGGQILRVGVSMLAGILFARFLGPKGMGQYELFRSTATIVATLVAMGMGAATIYFLNNRKVPADLLVTTTAKAISVLGIVLAVVLTATFLSNRSYFGEISPVIAAAFALGVGALMAAGVLRAVLVAEMAARRMVVVDLAGVVLLLATGTALALSGLLKSQTALLALAVGNCGSLTLVIYFLRRHIRLSLPFDWRMLGNIIVYGVKLAAASFLYVLSYNLTVLLLRWLSPEGFSEVGLYTRAVAVCSLATLMPTALGPLLLAKLAGSTGPTRARQAEMACRIYVVYGLVACAGILLLGKYVIWLLYGKAYLGAQVALLILGPAIALNPLFSVCNNLLAGDGKALLTAGILVGTVAVVASVTCLAVPHLGIRGAALGALCANAFTAVASMAVCRRLYGLKLANCFLPQKSDFRYVLSALKG